MTSSSVCLSLADLYTNTPLNFAHRGARRQAPENTLPAFQLAVELGADGTELDVHLSADGHPVVIHDAAVNRTTDGEGLVRSLPLAAIKELDAGVGYDAYSGISVPTLGEVFEAIGQQLLINVELKPSLSQSASAARMAQVVATTITQHNMAQRVIVSSFNPYALRAFRRNAPHIATGLLFAPHPLPLRLVGWVASWLVKGYDAHHPHFSMVDESYVQRIHGQGHRVNAWTVNELDDIKRMRDLGVDMIISDTPDLVRQVISSEV